MSDFRELVLKNRSYRRFDGSYEITKDTLISLVDLARNTASAANRQPLRYKLSCKKDTNDIIFNTLFWAGALPDWDGPCEAERPTAYIILLTDKNAANSSLHDEGIAAQTILLAATNIGLGGCMLGNVDRATLSKELSIPDNMSIKLVIALGKPVENVIIKDVGKDEGLAYYRDNEGNHYVPKIRLEDVII